MIILNLNFDSWVYVLFCFSLAFFIDLSEKKWFKVGLRHMKNFFFSGHSMKYSKEFIPECNHCFSVFHPFISFFKVISSKLVYDYQAFYHNLRFCIF
jgi:hypothetical protein